MMNEVQLHRLDLNLLVTFEALMDARSVSLAARKLGKTPSAVSHALARLRDQVGDPLLVKVGGKMRPSPFALTLIEDVRPVLRTIQRVVQPPQPFDPATSHRVFCVAMTAIPGLMSRVFERVNAQAPDAVLEWAAPGPSTLARAADGRVDIALLGDGLTPPDGVTRKVMPPLKVYTFARSGHPALENWSRDEWLRWPHLVIELGTVARTTVEERSADLELGRKIGARIPDFSAIAPLLARTNLLANNFAIALADDIEAHDLRVLEPPIPDLHGSLALYWSSRLANDPGNRWLREIVIESFNDLVNRAAARVAAVDVIRPQTG